MRLLPARLLAAGLAGTVVTSVLTACQVPAEIELPTRMPVAAGESFASAYGQSKPQQVDFIAPGKPVRLAVGKAAVTVLVSLPGGKSEASDRGVQAIPFQNIRRVDLEVKGENLEAPLTTSVEISGGSSAAGTIILPAGRNQIITATGRDAAGQVIATVKAAATSQAGKVSEVVVRYGSTPAAEILEALPADVVPRINLTALQNAIEDVTRPSGTPASYVTHPMLVRKSVFIDAIKAQLEAGMTPEQIDGAVLAAALYGKSKKIEMGAVTVSVVDVNGDVRPFRYEYGYADYYLVNWGGSRLNRRSYIGLHSQGTRIRLGTPLSPESEWIDGATTRSFPTEPGEWSLNLEPGVSLLPWVRILPPATSSVFDGANVKVQEGENVRLVWRDHDMSQPVLSGTGQATFSSTPYRDRIWDDPTSGEFWRVTTADSTIFRLHHFNSVYTEYGCIGNMCREDETLGRKSAVRVFRADGTQILGADAASGSFLYASEKAETLYIWTRFARTDATVSVTPLSSAEAISTTKVDFNQ
ncbi:MAG: hypothetical protein VKO21_01435 [Candidatus Sericytochromatia bacterium]|nr:hypothetical protein [Candidatus Sericytochromatia bacterium]